MDIVDLLGVVPCQFVFTNKDFISRILRRAESAGVETREAIMRSLSIAARSRSRSGTPGKPFPEDIQLKEQAQEFVKSYPEGSVESAFYYSVMQSAELMIQATIERDQEDF